MAGQEGSGGEGSINLSLEETPSWALATVCFVFIFLGLCAEYLIHVASHWLKKHKKSSMYEATEKLKSVLMLLGFMSLLLTATQRSISKICISNHEADTMLPCRSRTGTQTTKSFEHFWATLNNHDARTETSMSRNERGLKEENSYTSLDHCSTKGMTSLMSEGGINQLNIFIFVIAMMQIVYSIATMALGRAKMKRWKAWEKETQTVEYMAANDPERFRYTRQTTFGRRHMSPYGSNSALLWIKCFLRQFFRSVAKIDYLTLRHGFISAHLSMNNSFNFQKYIKRSLEDDFKAVIGISPVMWLAVVIFLLVDVHGWHAYLWISFLPLIIVLVIGTKLEVVVARMAMQLTNQSTVIKGTPLVQPNNNLFWFNRPQLVLTLLHFTIFMNAFEFSFFIWVTWQFGIKSCYHEDIEVIVIRVVLAIMVQILCSYITLPLYALVTQVLVHKPIILVFVAKKKKMFSSYTQMGSQFKSAILEEQTIHKIKEWHEDVKHKRKREPHSPEPPRARDDASTVHSHSDEGSSHRRSPTLPVLVPPLDVRGDHEITEDADDHHNTQGIDISQQISKNELDHIVHQRS